MQRVEAAGGRQVAGEQHVRPDSLPPRLQQLQRLRHLHVAQVSHRRRRTHAADLGHSHRRASG